MQWTDRDSISSGLAARARRVFSGSNTRALVWMDPHPPYIARGAGAHVHDVDGNSYLDLANNLGVLIHGHAHPDVVAAVQKQATSGSCFALPTESEIELAELLCARVPSFERIRFANTGSEAVQLALRAARAYTGRKKIAKLEGVYHGSSDLAEISSYVSPENWGNEPRPVATLKGTPDGFADAVVVIPANDAETTLRILREHAHDLAAVLLDPAPPRCGMRPLDPAYVSQVRAFTRETGTLLIYDEVIAFRLGPSGAQGRFDGDPDLTALGKIIGGGYPVGAVAGRAAPMEVVATESGSSGTFTANPVTMVAGLAAMRALTPDRFDALDALGERLRTGLADVIASRGRTAQWQVTGVGSLLTIHPHARPIHDYRTYYRSAEESTRMNALYRGLLEHGVLSSGSGTCFLSTAISTGDEARFIDAFDATLRTLG